MILSVLAEASFHEYGMVAEQVTVEAVPRVTAVPASSMIELPVLASNTLAVMLQAILVVLAMVESTVIVKLATIFPVNVVAAGGSAS